ncbi:penicillin-binding transpeptidase domain-containing protein [Pigmentibacter sp. JX0631]|uniref:penicillin-binding transpeptidase domain-containing protein n=1 Tax=Pigmentibacter sp. JX0631 TaxID=2976982 RepID=UPI00246837DB|nr:penicillin-binding transpeptidase domain-containing protein [Pigmentibacter sp. JX0631]WGL59828.1 penicillin-binding transpeptidase domain-containing protein [Pigmentibacter sp. JX0631]
MRTKLLISSIFFSTCSYAEEINFSQYYKDAEGCFFLYDVQSDKYVIEYKTELCTTPTPPNSTFKIPLSIMGYDKKILKTASLPTWEFKKEYLRDGVKDWMPKQWVSPVNPTIWLQYSVVWYSEKLVHEIGEKDINVYLEKFNYGNKDFKGISSDKEKLLIPWIDSSLKITAVEQLQFMKKFIKNELPVSKEALLKTKKNLFLADKSDINKVYGKTGAGYLENRIAHGWFVGWIEKNNNQYIFISQIKDKNSNGKFNHLIAKNNTFEFLKKLNFIAEK